VPQISDDAYVLRHWPYSETSQTVSLFCREHGVLRGLAKGARRERGTFSGGFEVLDLGQIVAILRPNADLALLTEWGLTRRPTSIYRSLPAHHAALYIADLVRHALTDEDPHPALWDAMDSAVRAMDAGANPGGATLRFQWATLGETGHRPELRRPEIGDEGGDVLGYDPAAGRLIPDPGPQHAGPEVWRIRSETLRLLWSLDESPAGEASADARAIERANRFLASCLRWVLGRELPTIAPLFDEG